MFSLFWGGLECFLRGAELGVVGVLVVLGLVVDVGLRLFLCFVGSCDWYFDGLLDWLFLRVCLMRFQFGFRGLGV